MERSLLFYSWPRFYSHSHSKQVSQTTLKPSLSQFWWTYLKNNNKWAVVAHTLNPSTEAETGGSL